MPRLGATTFVFDRARGEVVERPETKRFPVIELLRTDVDFSELRELTDDMRRRICTFTLGIRDEYCAGRGTHAKTTTDALDTEPLPLRSADDVRTRRQMPALLQPNTPPSGRELGRPLPPSDADRATSSGRGSRRTGQRVHDRRPLRRDRRAADAEIRAENHDTTTEEAGEDRCKRNICE
jgi:hypothetical protein